MGRSLRVASVAVALLAAAAATLDWAIRASGPAKGTHDEAPPLVHVEPPPLPTPNATALREHDSGASGVDLLHVHADGRGLVAPAAAGVARLTLDEDLQRTTLELLSAHRLPEAAVVLMETQTGRVLVYASHVEHGPLRDICAEATAPSASVFKIVTAAALVEDAHLGPETSQCYSGGEQRISASDLVPDASRDRFCTTLGGALGRSINTVFARLASEHLSPADVEAMAKRFGYGEAIAFDVPVQASAVNVPSAPLDFARTAAGFWNTTLSPLQAVEISAIVARGGETVRPVVVESVTGGDGGSVWSAPPSDPKPRRAIARETADALATMMTRTVADGTSYRAFHDGRGTAFLPKLGVAGKTGTLTEASAQRYYTWFTGFAPLRDDSGAKGVAIAVLVVNGPVWQVKANVIARDVLRAYFAAHDVKGVSRPSTAAIARVRH